MNSKGLNYKLVNVALVGLIIWLVVSTGNFWFSAFDKILEVLVPFVLAFAFAYVLHPFLKWLEKLKIPKWLGVGIIVLLVIGFVVLIMYLLTPLVYNQLKELISSVIKFIQDMSKKYSLDLNSIQSYISNINTLIMDIGKYLSESAINVISASISILTIIIIAFFTGIYFLADMDNIRSNVKNFFKKKNKKTYELVRQLDLEMKNYFIGLEKNILVQLIEYTLVYYVIGHPYYLVLGILASFSTIIPYFGGIFTNIIALITAIVVSPKLFILTAIVAIIFPNIDGYFWSPKIYGKTNNIHPVITIFSVFAGGALLGMMGIIIALPVAIILSKIYKFYLKDNKLLGKNG